jgi:protein NrfC
MEESFMAREGNTAPEKAEKKKFSRRDFVVGSGTALAGGAVAVLSSGTKGVATAEAAEKNPYEPSTRYLVYDSKHCAGCYGCMIACSMAHDGEVSFSLSRIQMHRAVLNEYPEDIIMHVCKQCPDPSCVRYCPTGACHVSAENGNIRMIDAEKCIGCQTCIKMCSQTPHRTIWNPKTNKSTKCDLCTNTPFFNKKGGVTGTQACVEACPKQVLKVVDKLPSETGGYEIFIAPPPRPKMGFGAPGAGGPGAKAKPATPEQAPKTPDPKR